MFRGCLEDSARVSTVLVTGVTENDEVSVNAAVD